MPQMQSLKNAYPKIQQSQALLDRAEGLIPAYTQTLAKGPGQHIKGVAPIYAVRGKGARITDADGNEFLDCTMGVGPVVLGYGYVKVDYAIKAQLNDGITFSLMHPLEVEVAEMIRAVIPNAEMVRFSKTGCDVTTAAVRLARAYTGKNTVLCCGYHGWHDWYIAVTDRNAGIPHDVQQYSYTFNYNDIESLIQAIDDDTAAIILEPIVFEEPKNNFLHQLRDICTERGIVLIFDEMWTGFRLAVGGAQEYFGVKADMACFSKAVANGMPLSILTGRADIMRLLEKDVFFFTTFGGEALSLSAAKATIREIQEFRVTEYIARLGKILKDGYNAIAKEQGMTYTKCIGLDCRTMVTFTAPHDKVTALEMKSFVQQELIRCGVLWTGFHNLSFSHTEQDIEYLLNAYRMILPQLHSAVQDHTLPSLLRGTPVEPVFRKTTNFHTKAKAV